MTNLTEKYDSEGYIDFPVAKFGVYHNHKPEKVNPTTSVTIRISGVTDKYLGNDTVSLRRMPTQENARGLLSTNNFMLSLTKLIGLILSTAQTILPGKIQFRFLQ